MDATKLKTLQAPLKQQYKDDPDSAVITLKANGRIGEGWRHWLRVQALL